MAHGATIDSKGEDVTLHCCCSVLKIVNHLFYSPLLWGFLTACSCLYLMAELVASIIHT